MAKKTPKQLDEEIDAYLRHEKIGPRVLRPAPKWDSKFSAWTGGDKGTLYAFPYFDIAANRELVIVKPGTGQSGKAGIIGGIGSGVKAPRIATRAEAETGWQNPLHSGWNVKA